jgi:hypothetical protein
MKIDSLVAIIEARVICREADKEVEVFEAFASDLMSDVLTIGNHHPVLITGLSNIQTIRTAEMADIKVIVLARGKKASSDMILLAEENNMILIETSYSVFKTSGILYQNGIQALY